MESKAEILVLLNEYAKKYYDEQEETTQILSFVNRYNDKELFDRKNFDGHITASAFIINRKRDSLLLLKHQFLQRWLQPGGHIDYSDKSLIAAAQREAEEETGLNATDLQIISDDIFDIDSHTIPENVKKQELAHIHHDIRFLFLSSSDAITIAEEESTGSIWVPIVDLRDDDGFGRVARKIQNVEFEQISPA